MLKDIIKNLKCNNFSAFFEQKLSMSKLPQIQVERVFRDNLKIKSIEQVKVRESRVKNTYGALKAFLVLGSFY